MNTILRVIAALALMVAGFFCVYGFLASREFTEASKRLPQQIVYGAMGLACLVGAFRLLRRRRQPPGSATKRSAEQNGRWGIRLCVVAGFIPGTVIGTFFQSIIAGLLLLLLAVLVACVLFLAGSAQRGAPM